MLNDIGSGVVDDDGSDGGNIFLYDGSSNGIFLSGIKNCDDDDILSYVFVILIRSFSSVFTVLIIASLLWIMFTRKVEIYCQLPLLCMVMWQTFMTKLMDYDYFLIVNLCISFVSCMIAMTLLIALQVHKRYAKWRYNISSNNASTDGVYNCKISSTLELDGMSKMRTISVPE